MNQLRNVCWKLKASLILFFCYCSTPVFVHAATTIQPGDRFYIIDTRGAYWNIDTNKTDNRHIVEFQEYNMPRPTAVFYFDPKSELKHNGAVRIMTADGLILNFHPTLRQFFAISRDPQKDETFYLEIGDQPVLYSDQPGVAIRTESYGNRHYYAGEEDPVNDGRVRGVKDRVGYKFVKVPPPPPTTPPVVPSPSTNTIDPRRNVDPEPPKLSLLALAVIGVTFSAIVGIVFFSSLRGRSRIPILWLSGLISLFLVSAPGQIADMMGIKDKGRTSIFFVAFGVTFLVVIAVWGFISVSRKGRSGSRRSSTSKR